MKTAHTQDFMLKYSVFLDMPKIHFWYIWSSKNTKKNIRILKNIKMRSHHSPVSNSWGVKLNFAKWGPSILREWPFVFILGEGSGSSKFVSRICPTLLDRLLFKVSFPPPLVISWSITEKGKYLIEGILDPVLLAVLKI